MIKLKYSDDCGWTCFPVQTTATQQHLHVQALLRTRAPVPHQKAELLHSFQDELLVSDLSDSQLLQLLGRQLEQIHA